MPRAAIHPGEILAEELANIGLSADRLASVIEVPPNHIDQLLAGKRSMSQDTASRLGKQFGVSADFWMNLQMAYDLDFARQQAE